MNKKARAVEVIPDKLWITYDSDGTKTGTMLVSSDDPVWLIQYLVSGDCITHARAEIDLGFDFEARTAADDHNDHHYVFGYPTTHVDLFKTQERDNLPCFTKTVTSKVFFAAGYYGINFDNGGWMEAFCPKLSTLRKYQYAGPFKTLTDAQIAIRRKQRNYE